MRQGDWKWVQNKGDPAELYDLATDPSEQINLAPRQPARMKELAALFAKWNALNPPLDPAHRAKEGPE